MEKKKKTLERKTEPVKKKKKTKTEDRTSEKKKKKNRTANPGKKKVKVVKSCDLYCLRVPHVCLITEMLLSYELLFSVSIIHNSKIRELSDESRVMETKLSFVKQPFCYGSHHFWVMSYGNRELSYQKKAIQTAPNILYLCYIGSDTNNSSHAV